MTQAIDPQIIAHYLLNHPDFFEQHAEILSEVRLTSPVIGKAVSLHERQMEVMRTKYKNLELQLSQLMHTAQNNKRLMDKAVDWICALFAEPDKTAMPQTIVQQLETIFNVPEVTLRLWNLPETYASHWFTQDITESIRTWAGQMPHPYCGKMQLQLEAAQWLKQATDIRSVAILPLRKTAALTPFGLLVMGSPDVTRFRSDMATDFLSMIGKMAAAALAPIYSAD